MNTFVADRIVEKKGARLALAEIKQAYVSFTGSSVGIKTIIADIETAFNVEKTTVNRRVAYKNIAFRTQESRVETAPTPVVDAPAAPTPAAVAPQPETSGMTEYQRAKLALRKEALVSEREIEKEKIAIEKEKALATKEIEKEKILVTKEIAAMKISVKKEMQEKDHAFMREENSKNRAMYAAERFNKYIDLKAYGTPSQQYITRESITDVLSFNAYNATGAIDPTTRKSIIRSIKQECEDVPIVDGGVTEVLPAINIKSVGKIIENVCETFDDEKTKTSLSRAFTTVSNDAATISSIAEGDRNRIVESSYIKAKKAQSNSVHKTMKDKIKYVKPLNNISTNAGGNITIKCFCCLNPVELESAGCNRAHNIPRSDGGDCSVSNIYLTCSTCNQNMSNDMSVLEYKTELFVKAVDALLETEAESDASTDTETDTETESDADTDAENDTETETDIETDGKDL